MWRAPIAVDADLSREGHSGPRLPLASETVPIAAIQKVMPLTRPISVLQPALAVAPDVAAERSVRQILMALRPLKHQEQLPVCAVAGSTFRFASRQVATGVRPRVPLGAIRTRLPSSVAVLATVDVVNRELSLTTAYAATRAEDVPPVVGSLASIANVRLRAVHTAAATSSFSASWIAALLSCQFLSRQTAQTRTCPQPSFLVRFRATLVY